MPTKTPSPRDVVSEARRKAAFAKAMTRSEFGRFYSDDAEQAEVRRSLERRPPMQPVRKS